MHGLSSEIHAVAFESLLFIANVPLPMIIEYKPVPRSNAGAVKLIGASARLPSSFGKKIVAVAKLSSTVHGGAGTAKMGSHLMPSEYDFAQPP
jgi:uncharacterized membrane protein